MADIGIDRFFRGITKNLEPAVQHHLKNVYSAVSFSVGSAAVGAFVHLYSTILGAGVLSSLASVGLLVGLLATPHDGKNQLQRLGLLCGFAFLSGLNLGPLLQMAVAVSETIVMEALLATAVVFASFSLTALFAPRGHWLFLGGSLLSLLSTLFWLSLFNLFFGSALLFQAGLYLSLLTMCGFIVYDTQLICEKRRMGDSDYVKHALDLFIDLISVFRKLLVILTDKEASKKKRRN